MREILIEACCADIESVINAKEGGADRIELCSALETGGVTPSAGLLEDSVKIFGKGVMVLIRPRPGNFVYTKAEVGVMKKDIEFCVKAGAGGVVIGALNPDGSIDRQACKEMLQAANGIETIFHRAIDQCDDTLEAMEELIGLGFNRILTSGNALSAYEGREMLGKMIDQAGDRIEILPGGGVKAENVAELVRVSKCRQIHTSAKGKSKVSDKVKKGDKDAFGEYASLTSAETLKEIRSIINTL